MTQDEQIQRFLDLAYWGIVAYGVFQMVVGVACLAIIILISRQTFGRWQERKERRSPWRR